MTNFLKIFFDLISGNFDTTRLFKLVTYNPGLTKIITDDRQKKQSVCFPNLNTYATLYFLGWCVTIISRAFNTALFEVAFCSW